MQGCRLSELKLLGSGVRMLRFATTTLDIAYSPYRRCTAFSGPMNRCGWTCRSCRSNGDSETADSLVAAHEDATYQSWRAALRSCLARPGLSRADRQSARRVFDQSWAKAQAYRRIHKADYEQIASLTSRKAHTARLFTLDKPLEGLFAEFRLRLAAIGPRPARTTATSR